MLLKNKLLLAVEEAEKVRAQVCEKKVADLFEIASKLCEEVAKRAERCVLFDVLLEGSPWPSAPFSASGMQAFVVTALAEKLVSEGLKVAVVSSGKLSLN